MGIVYRATQLSLGRTVALKVVVRELVDDAGFRMRFQREARAAAALDHPHIVSIHEAGQVGGVLYIAMQWIEGGDLRRHLKSGGAMEPEHAVRMLSQIASALDVAHGRGLLHRDVKPANILLRDMPSGIHSYLSDFGVARPFVELRRGSRDGLTAPGHMVGTPGYMAPEQIEVREVDGRTDLYALGCVLFEALTGKPPFARDTDFALMFAHTHDARPLVSQVKPGLGTAFDDVLRRAISIDPKDRYRTGRELTEAAEEAARAPRSKRLVVAFDQPGSKPAGHPATPIPQTPVPPGSEQAPRTPVPPSGTPIPWTPVPPTGGEYGTPWPADRPSRIPTDPVRRGRTNAIVLLVASLLVLGIVIALLVQGGDSSGSVVSTTTPSTSPSATEPTGTPEGRRRRQVVEVVRAFAAALYDNRPPALRATLAPNVTRWVLGATGPCKVGKASVVAYYEGQLAGATQLQFPGLKASDVELHGSDAAVVRKAGLVDENTRRYRFTLHKVDGDWKITRIAAPSC